MLSSLVPKELILTFPPMFFFVYFLRFVLVLAKYNILLVLSFQITRLSGADGLIPLSCILIVLFVFQRLREA